MITCKFENGGDASLRHVTVDTLVIKNNQVLLVKRTGKLLEGGKWGLVGGFVERDESLQKAVEREVCEETGWEIDKPKLLTIRDNPKRPREDRQNIVFVYVCNAVRKVGIPDNESDDQRWFDLNQIPPEEELAFDHFSDIQMYLSSLKSPVNPTSEIEQ